MMELPPNAMHQLMHPTLYKKLDDIITRLERIEANISGLLLIQQGETTTLPILEHLLLMTLSEREDERAWAQKYLHEYVVMRKRQEDARNA